VTATAHDTDQPRVALSVDEAAARLGISEWSVRQAIKRGEIPARRVGNRVLVPVDAIDNFFNSETTS
jgi:excisionase family DNA binding protein